MISFKPTNTLIGAKTSKLWATPGRQTLGTAMVVAALFSTTADISFAQVNENIRNEAERIQREQRLRLERQRQELRPRRDQQGIDLPTPTPPVDSEARCIDISTVTVEGVAQERARAVERLSSALANRCVTANDIKSLLTDITAFYIRRGLITSRAFLPQQDLSTGQLKILVSEGRIESFQLNDGDTNSINLPLIFPYLTGEVLNLRDIEHGLESLSRQRSNNVELELLPGTGTGQTIVNLNNKPGRRIYGSLSADSTGERTTGRYGVNLTLTLDRPFGLNDILSFSRKESWPIAQTGQNSDSQLLQYSLPLGRATWDVSVTGSSYASTLRTPGGVSLLLSGRSTNINAGFSYAAYHDQQWQVNVTGRLTKKNSKNFLDTQFLGVSSRTLTVLDLGLNFFGILSGATVSGGIGFARGLKLFGALKDPANQQGNEPRAQFDKLTLNANYTQPFSQWGQNFSYSGSLNAQFARTTLFGSEHISIGGPFSVRGFYRQSLANDHGLYLRNELRWRNAISFQDVTLTPYAGLDVGAVGGRVSNTSAGILAGGAAGLTLSHPIGSLDIFAALPLAYPSTFDYESLSVFGSVRLNF